LIAGHVLKRHLPSGAGVLKGQNLDLEVALVWVEARHLDRCAPIIEQPTGIPGHEEAQIARLKV
jgi:hypothetical protein